MLKILFQVKGENVFLHKPSTLWFTFNTSVENFIVYNICTETFIICEKYVFVKYSKVSGD